MSSNLPLLKAQNGSAHFNAYRLSSVKDEHSSCPQSKQHRNPLLKSLGSSAVPQLCVCVRVYYLIKGSQKAITS